MKTLKDYQQAIMKLPLTDKYTKEALLIPDFLVAQEGNVAIYYAPHNEYINPKAKVLIIGITPGFQQMSTAMVAARKGFEEGLSIEAIQYACKAAGRFSGSLRKNIITMLDTLGLQENLGLASCSQLFDTEDALLHTVSLIPYPTFVKGANYTGHTPKRLKSAFLMRYVRKAFQANFDVLEEKENVLVIPLGRAVEEVLDRLAEEGLLDKTQILHHFPHPSGANVNRIPQLEMYQEGMRTFLEQHFYCKRKRPLA